MLGSVSNHIKSLFKDKTFGIWDLSGLAFRVISPPQDGSWPPGWHVHVATCQDPKRPKFYGISLASWEDYPNKSISGWWFQIFFIFTPIWGRWTHFDEHIFQRGWNHQLDINSQGTKQINFPKNRVFWPLWDHPFFVSKSHKSINDPIRPIVLQNDKSINEATNNQLTCFF